VVAVLPRGEAIRNFVWSGALDELQRTRPVRLLSVLPDESIARTLRERYSAVDELREIGERRAVRVLRELLDMAHGRWLWSEAARERWRLRDAEAPSGRARAKRVAKKLLIAPFSNRPGLRILEGLERGASRILRTTGEYARLFGETRPALVFNGSHVHGPVAVQAVQAAQWLGIPTCAFLFSWDNLTSQGRIIPLYDRYLVWNARIREQLLSIYPSIRPESVHVTGTPQFDFHFRDGYRWSRGEFCARVGADPQRPIVLYSTGMANHMPGEERIVEGIADMLRGMPSRPQLLVRVYPKDRTGRFDRLKRGRNDILFPGVPWEPRWLTPKEEDLALLSNTLRHCALGINVASTISLELCMFDKPALNVGYNPQGVPPSEVDYARYYRFEHYRPVVESGAVTVASSPEALRAAIAAALTEPSRGRGERERLLRDFFGDTLDGKSASRVARALAEIAGE
jgi:hypothetical protein